MKPYLILFLLGLITNHSLSQSLDVFGKYESNFAIWSTFGTTLELKSDSTFFYYESGDMTSGMLYGNWRVEEKHLILSDFWIEDNSHYVNNDSILLANPPRLFLIKKNRLYFTNENMKTKRRAKGAYSGFVKFITFGKYQWTKKRYFLKKQI